MVNERGIEFEYVDLPSKGECYPHKKGRVPVAYMTAKDENIVASEELRAKGKDIDVLLNAKMLDSDFRAEELCVADRERILLWLYTTSYGNEYIEPVLKQHHNLSNVIIDNMDYFGDENGLFIYTTSDGVMLKYRLPNHSDDKIVREYMDEGILDGDLDIIDKTKVYFIKQQTVAVDGVNKKNKIDELIESLSYEEQMGLFEFMCNNAPEVRYGVDFENILYHKVKSICQVSGV
ncbi:MAG: hypothetical protein LUD72_04425 [Bacteroidales bacterium]|nr:hypothetical protein [Bacteroidales bacterium]